MCLVGVRIVCASWCASSDQRKRGACDSLCLVCASCLMEGACASSFGPLLGAGEWCREVPVRLVDSAANRVSLTPVGEAAFDQALEPAPGLDLPGAFGGALHQVRHFLPRESRGCGSEVAEEVGALEHADRPPGVIELDVEWADLARW